MKNNLLRISAIIAVFALSACEKEESNVPTPTYSVPTTYTFDNVNYTGQTQRIAMLDELVLEIRKANTAGVTTSAIKLKEMYSNINNPFSNTDLNNSGKQLKDKTFLADRATIEKYFDSLEVVSASTQTGANGVAGRITTLDGASTYLFDANGIEYKEVIEKGLYGSLLYYQMTSVYFSNEKMNVDNETVVAGQGTAMQHHWDEAFGYLGVPTDFPTNVNGIKFLGRYVNLRDAKINCNKVIMDAFIKGRAAINNKDYATRDAQIVIISNELEKAMAATAINYLNQAKNNFADDARRNHTLSECKGFLNALKYNIRKKITDSQIAELQTLLGDNNYEITLNNIEAMKTLLADIYGLQSVKDSL